MLLDSEQAAELLNVSTRTLREFVKAGDIAYVPLGAGRSKPRLGFTMEDINDFIKSRRARACPSTSMPKVRSTNTTSKSTVVAFSDLQRLGISKKPKR
ncbi:Helix-turn-helix domain protein [compost metagenome]